MLQKHAAFFFAFLVSGFVQAQVTKIDPLLSTFAKENSAPFSETESGSAGGIGVAKAISYNNYGRLVADCFVEVYSPDDLHPIANRIESYGGVVRSRLTTIMTASIPLDLIEEIAGWEEVRYIEAGKPLSGKLSHSINTVRAAEVQAGSGLDKRYDGRGVIVGIVDDTRLDWGHNDFKDNNNKTRILFIWDKNNSGSGVSEIKDSTGLECTKVKIDAGTCAATAGGDTGSHATHVAGIAAGDDATFKGMAPGANIISVFNVESDADSGANLSTTIVDDVRYVFAKATSEKMPAVVNLSLGTSIGAHDDTSSMEKSLNELVVNQPGRAIVNAAGNETFTPNDTGAATYNGIHAGISVAGGAHAFDFAVRNGTTLISNGREVIIDIWLNAASSCTVELDSFDFAKTAVSIDMDTVSAGQVRTKTLSGVTTRVDFSDSTNANNGKKHAIAKVTFDSSITGAQMQTDYSFDLIFRGTCTGDAWIWPDRTATVSYTLRFIGTDRGFGYTYQQGDSDKVITIPGTASKLITVGSFKDRASWTDSGGTVHYQTAVSGTDFTSLGATGGTVGAISPFSSRGPTADGRAKPDISAPGEPIVSSMSANNSVAGGRKADSGHFKNEGTSMSAPHITGIIALIFQKNKCLTSSQVKQILINNVKTDSYTGTTNLPSATFGFGKIDALAAMQDVVSYSGTCSSTGASGEQLTPVTTTSGEAASSSCMNVSGSNSKSDAMMVWVTMYLLTLSAYFTRKKTNATKSVGAGMESCQAGAFKKVESVDAGRFGKL